MENEVNTEAEADALLNSIDEPSIESADPGVDAPAAPAAEEYTLKVGGKDIKASRDQVLRWAQQGHDSPNKIGELNKQLQSWTAKEQEWKAKEAQIQAFRDKYEPVDKYVKDNPQWWETVQKSYDQVQAQSSQVNDPRIDSLMKKIESLESVSQSYEQRAQNELMKIEDAKYMESFQALQKQYPKIDFATADESGKNLEYKVLEFAQKEGIKEFTTAFKAFHHDELVKMAQEDAKEKVASDKISKTKLGILGISSTPTPRKTDSVKGKSYNDIQADIIAEYGLT